MQCFWVSPSCFSLRLPVGPLFAFGSTGGYLTADVNLGHLLQIKQHLLLSDGICVRGIFFESPNQFQAKVNFPLNSDRSIVSRTCSVRSVCFVSPALFLPAREAQQL